ncbi:TIGR02117 family protein [Gelidibacter maritimus]|uniref:TIGR02117 family protein n=1 Tax=Gelidibacter maritimus TaxID=2761487 RepID=A0A7W2M7U2_9FLAO|nr:TIGR02117 family protein [Gelidibacter maritimus]MBA6154290.1 TIGR02117 family protein [Gelidibacter maritimus]
MKCLKKLVKGVLWLLLLPFSYIIISLLLTFITVNNSHQTEIDTETIYLSTNGVHLNIILPITQIDKPLLKDIKYDNGDSYLSFGWGEENFYINTPNWSDLTLKNALKALFIKSSTLIHISRYGTKQSDWTEVKLSNIQLKQLNRYLRNSFKTDGSGHKIILPNQGYTPSDDFYKAHGNYTIFNTCNTWVNTGFKESGLKACLWTPFDFGLINTYK